MQNGSSRKDENPFRRPFLGKKEGAERIPSGCAISGIFSKSGKCIGGEEIIRTMLPMHDRSNGLGGGYAGYGIYPQYKELYAFHIFFDDDAAKDDCDHHLNKYYDVAGMAKIPVKPLKTITDAPMTFRYFVCPKGNALRDSQLNEREFVARSVLFLNSKMQGVYVFSSGKNMGVFKGVGFPEDIGHYFKLEDYGATCWTAHGRYPTNTPGWWGGAHPFALLDITVVHNGEISSYDANKRCMEMFGYACTLLTDTEVIAYMIDYLTRRQGLTMEETANVIAAPFWSTINHMPPADKKRMTMLRSMYASMLITGPFSILVGFENGMMALNDRLKLRSMVAAERGDRCYVASEECAIRMLEPVLDRIWMPKGGEPVIFRRQEEDA